MYILILSVEPVPVKETQWGEVIVFYKDLFIGDMVDLVDVATHCSVVVS